MLPTREEQDAKRAAAVARAATALVAVATEMHDGFAVPVLAPATDVREVARYRPGVD